MSVHEALVRSNDVDGREIDEPIERAGASRRFSFGLWTVGKRGMDPVRARGALARVTIPAPEPVSMSRRDELFTAVYDAPDDDAPRRTLARHLRRAKDPRGEFIELQLAAAAGTVDRERRARAHALLGEHRDEWLGALSPVFQKSNGMRWERGFLCAARLAVPRSGVAPMERWVGLRELATLRSLDLDTGAIVVPYPWRERFVFHSPLRALRRIMGLPRSLVGRLLRSRPPWALETIEVELDGNAGRLEDVYAQQIREGFASGRGAPHLRSLSLTFAGANDPQRYDWLWTTAAGRRLASLAIARESFALTKWHPVLVEHAHEIALERFEARSISRLVLERANGAWSRLSGEIPRRHRDVVARRDLVSTLELLGPRIAEVDVAGFADEGRPHRSGPA